MAYIAFHEFDSQVVAQYPLPVAPAADPVSSDSDRLTDLEWRVVAIARKDGPLTLRRPGRLTTALRVLLSRPNPMLTDPRLEALRRMAVLTWRRGYSVPTHEVRAFFDAGFSAGQYETLADYIGAARVDPPTQVRINGYVHAQA